MPKFAFPFAHHAGGDGIAHHIRRAAPYFWSMPKLYEYFGLVFLMFSNEHSPIHVHVRYGGTEAVLELIIIGGEVVGVVFRKLSNKRMLPPSKQREAEAFVHAKAADIARKWNEYFVLHQHVAPERITKRIT
jgi:hypothetical protein